MNAQRFWSHVNKNGPVSRPELGECWVWTGSVQKRITGAGYGRFNVGNRTPVGAHRVSYEMAYGVIPQGMFVCHKCDNRICVRPDHLFIGSPLDNQLDAKRKGRLISGERHPNAVLTDNEVCEIRKLASGGMRLVDIAPMFHVAPQTISKIVLHKRRREPTE